MIEVKKYEVLQFVEQKTNCHMVHDNISGNTLMEYVKEQVMLDKIKVFRIAQSLAEQLEKFYRCEEQEAYGYVTPYAVVVKENGEVRLLDIWTEDNKKHLVKMKKKKVRVLFVSPTYVLSQKRHKEDDWFGYGKTVQFLVEKCCDANSLTFFERSVLKKIYVKCQEEKKACIDDWKKIQNFLRKIRKDGERRQMIKIGRSVLLLVIATVVIGVVIGTQLQEKPEPIIIEKPVEVLVEPEEDNETYTKMLELNYKETLSLDEQTELERIVEKIIQENSMEDSWIHQKCLAQSLEKLGQYEAAIIKYEELMKYEIEDAELKYVYEKLMELYDFVDLPEKKIEIYVKALETFPEWEEKSE